MKTSRLKFVSIFVISSLAFLMGTISLLNQKAEAFLGSESQAGWQSLITTIISPIKIVLVGPLLPYINFLRQDPDTPPPFYLIGFVMYWIILALVIYYVLKKRNSLNLINR